MLWWCQVMTPQTSKKSNHTQMLYAEYSCPDDCLAIVVLQEQFLSGRVIVVDVLQEQLLSERAMAIDGIVVQW